MINFTQLVQDVIDGEEDPLKAYGVLKGLEKQIKAALDEIHPDVLEAATVHEKTFKHSGFRFEYRNGGASYSYKNIADWVEKSKELKEIEAKAKGAYSSYQQGLRTTSEDGEIIDLPEVTYRKDTLIVNQLS